MKSRIDFLRTARAKQTWLFLVIAWAIIRTIAVKDFFSAYGIHPWIYLVIDLISSIPYAHFSANLLISFLDIHWESLTKNFLFTTIFFYVPDLYIFTAARRIPNQLLIGFIISVLFFSAIAILGFIKKIRDGRQ